MQTKPLKVDSLKRKRRWFQFSLRTLMIVVTLLAVAVSSHLCGAVALDPSKGRDSKVGDWRDVESGGAAAFVRIAVKCYNALGEIKVDRKRRSIMDASRKATREGNETTLQYQSPQDALLVEERNEGLLTQLLESVSRLKETPLGAAEIERRIKLFGDCKRIEGETSGQFYGKLRHWLDREMPQTKSPRHVPRQTGD